VLTKFDNGGRFDLRLPYAEQGYVDKDADVLGKIFGRSKMTNKIKDGMENEMKGKAQAQKQVSTKAKLWPWEK